LGTLQYRSRSRYARQGDKLHKLLQEQRAVGRQITAMMIDNRPFVQQSCLEIIKDLIEGMPV